MGVFKNRGTPKSSIFIGISIINHPFWGYPYFWKHPYMVFGHFLVSASSSHLTPHSIPKLHSEKLSRSDCNMTLCSRNSVESYGNVTCVCDIHTPKKLTCHPKRGHDNLLYRYTLNIRKHCQSVVPKYSNPVPLTCCC